MTSELLPKQIPPETPAGIRRPFPRFEAAAVVVILVAFVAGLAATTLRIQPVWLDEVTVADPAVNLYSKKGFTSTGWQYQTKEEFWASNAPLHQILLFHWMKVFGFNPVSVRSISFVFMALTIGLLWLAVLRLDLITTPQGRMLLVLLLIGGAGITSSYLAGRYDCIGMLLLAAIPVVCTLDAPFWIRSMILMALAILIPVAGVNLVPYGVLMCGLLCLFLRKGFSREAACLGVGVLLGLFALYVLYVTNGVEKTLLVSAGGHGLSGTLGDDGDSVRREGLGPKVVYILTHLPIVLGKRFQNIFHWYFSDRSFVLVLAVLGIRAVVLKRAGTFSMKSVAGFGLLTAAVVPLVMGLLRNYPFYYSWMAYIPVSVCALSSCDPLWERPGAVGARVSLVAAVLLAAFQGYPGAVVQSWRTPAPNYAGVEAFVTANVSRQDRAYADFEAYYPIHRLATYVLLPTYKKMMSETEKKELTVLVVRAPNVKEATALVGGTWARVSALDLPEPYDLTLLRRQ